MRIVSLVALAVSVFSCTSVLAEESGVRLLSFSNAPGKGWVAKAKLNGDRGTLAQTVSALGAITRKTEGGYLDVGRNAVTGTVTVRFKNKSFAGYRVERSQVSDVVDAINNVGAPQDPRGGPAR